MAAYDLSNCAVRFAAALLVEHMSDAEWEVDTDGDYVSKPYIHKALVCSYILTRDIATRVVSHSAMIDNS